MHIQKLEAALHRAGVNIGAMVSPPNQQPDEWGADAMEEDEVTTREEEMKDDRREGWDDEPVERGGGGHGRGS